MFLRVGTRGSKLSLAQTGLVIERLRRIDPGLKVEKKIITTSGDEDRLTPLFFLNRKGIFEKEIDQAVLEGGVDFAVHSLKDLPVFGDDQTNLVIAGVPERGSPADVLVSRSNKQLSELRRGSTVGTSSLLRIAQLKHIHPDLKTEPVRGNVETRVAKVDKGEFDAVILAEAGLARLGMAGRISQRLPVEDFLPAPGQGILATVAKRDNRTIVELLQKIEHPPTRAEADAERELVKVLEGGCKVPVGALATAVGDGIQLTAYVLSVDGKERLQATRFGNMKDAAVMARKVGEVLMGQGAKRLEEGWRNLYS